MGFNPRLGITSIDFVAERRLKRMSYDETVDFNAHPTITGSIVAPRRDRFVLPNSVG